MTTQKAAQRKEWRHLRASDFPDYIAKTMPSDKIVGAVGTFVLPRLAFCKPPDLETIAEAARRFKTIPKAKE